MSNKRVVYIVDDDPDIRASLSRLADSINLRCITFECAERFLAEYDPSAAGCLVLDMHMPGMSGLALQRKLAADGVTLPVIIVTGYPDVPIAVDAMKAGAIDFFQKPFRPLDLIDSIQRALDKSGRQRVEEARKCDHLAKLRLLTPREREVVNLVVVGLSNTQIADRLGVTPQAVDSRRSSAYDKLGVQNVPELIRFLLRAGVDPVGR